MKKKKKKRTKWRKKGRITRKTMLMTWMAGKMMRKWLMMRKKRVLHKQGGARKRGRVKFMMIYEAVNQNQ